MSDAAVTGVLSANHVEGWFFETPEFDPEFEDALAEAQEHAKQEALDSGKDEDEAEDSAQEAGDALQDCWDTSSYSLYGDWQMDPPTGKYEANQNGANGFAAIFNRDYNTIQVVWSKNTVQAHRCSPCYPGQGDLDTPGDDYLCYALPLDLMSDGWKEEHQTRYAPQPQG